MASLFCVDNHDTLGTDHDSEMTMPYRAPAAQPLKRREHPERKHPLNSIELGIFIRTRGGLDPKTLQTSQTHFEHPQLFI
jgi:hypothetical protein